MINRRTKVLTAGLVGGAVALAAGASALGLGLTVRGGDHDRTGDVLSALKGGRAKNVILFIGDGMGDSEITVARNYAKGAAGHLAMDSLPFTGAYTTYAVKPGTADVPDYVPDSAATGTAWATGHKTYNNAVSFDPVTKKPLRTILELAQAKGYRTGDVTTAELTDATPAVLAAHVSQRACQGPLNMATCKGEAKPGGLGSIAEQQIAHGVDVLMGGGRDRFTQVYPAGHPAAGSTTLAQAQAAGYAYATDRAGMLAASEGKKFLGLFHPSNLETEWTGPIAAPYPGPGPVSCTESTPAFGAQPHLSEMTRKAIDLLDTGKRGKGFFLQVEGASIDKQDHAANACAQIGETVEFDRSIQVAREWAKKNPDTLIVVTADHGHTSQIIESQSASDHSPGNIVTLTTREGQPMVVNYATNLAGRSQSHTGTQVRIAAQGPQAANVLGVTNQTDLFATMARALGLS